MTGSGSEARRGVEQRITHCRICEALCGMVATVEDGRLTGLRPDKDNPHSRGFACAKGTAMVDVVNDPDRVLQPLKRVGGPGEFEPVSWDEALGDIARRLGDLRARYGPKSLAVFEGNPPYFSFSALFWAKGFQAALGTPWFYGVNSEDAGSRVVATQLLYGSSAHLPIPDYRRTDVMVIIGANPLVSKGSMFDDPRLREHFDELVARGGRIIVIDPRRTQTAARYEHVPVRAGTDAWLLLGIIGELHRQGLVDEAFVARWTTGADELRRRARELPLERVEAVTGVPADQVRELARVIGSARAAVVYGRTGTCTQRFGTLNNVLQDAINVLTGNVQREGGWTFGWSPIPVGELSDLLNVTSYDKVRTRVSGLPDVYGVLPTNALPDEILTPGEGQIRGLVSVGSNAVVTAPGGGDMERAMEALDLFVSLDIYVNDTNRLADYVLPTTTMYERDDLPVQFLPRFVRPAIFATEAVAQRRGDVREEWEILDEIIRRMGLGGAYSAPPLRWLAKAGIRVTPRHMMELLMRFSRVGDLFGLRRSGWSMRKLLERAPHGVLLHEHPPLAPLRKRIKTASKKITLDHPLIVQELDRMAAHDPAPDAEFPLRMIGMRETLSHNSWLHNSPRLVPPARRHALRINPADAEALPVADGDEVRIVSAAGAIAVPVEVTDVMTPGTVALPHGWGHRGGWQHANAAGGACSNLLASRQPGDLEPLAAMTVLNGIPVRLEPVATAPGRTTAARTAPARPAPAG